MNFPRPDGPRQILMTTDTVGGVWTYSLELSRALAQYDIEVILATMGARPTPDQTEQVAVMDNVRLVSSGFRLEWMEDPWDDVAKAGAWLLELEGEFHPDVIHLNGYTHADLDWRAPRLVTGHSCVLSWWQAVKQGPVPAEWAQYERLVKRGLHAADLVVAPSQAMLTALHHHYGPLPATKVIHNGRDPDGFSVGKKEEFILTAGRLWDEAKNTSALASVAGALPWPVIVAGERRSPDGNEMKLANVQLLGRRSEKEMALLYARAALYVSPTRYEPFGLSVLEAALSGCALVLGDIPSLRELWDGAARFVTPASTGALQAVLLDLISEPGKLHELAVRAYERSATLSSRRMARAYHSVYTDLMTSRRLNRCALSGGVA
jgi:glycogen(starch) synthase